MVPVTHNWDLNNFSDGLNIFGSFVNKGPLAKMLHSLDKNKSFYIDTIPLHSETCAYGLVRTTSHAIVYPLGCYKADELCLSENLNQKVRLFEILLNSILFCLLFFQ